MCEPDHGFDLCFFLDLCLNLLFVAGGERRGFAGGDKKAGAPRSGEIGFKGGAEGGRGRGAAPKQ